MNKVSDENVLVVIGRPVRLHVRLTGVNYLALEYAAPAKDFDESSSSENLPRVDSLVEEIVSAVDNNQYHA
jgi:hypothetical protein